MRILRDLGLKGLKVDPSTTLLSGLRINRARSLELKGKRSGELNTETQRTRRSETGTDLERGAERVVGLAASIGNGSTGFYYCQGLL